MWPAGIGCAVYIYAESPALPRAFTPQGIRCNRNQLGCLCNAARPDAGSAHTNVLSHTVNHRANTLQVWVPAAAARGVRVADHIAKTRPFAAKLTSHCHKYSSRNSRTHTKYRVYQSLSSSAR